jgi:hypothetical protein
MALLLASNGHPVSTERLIEGVYGDEAPDGVRHSIQTFISNLRSLCGEIIERRGDGYVLDASRRMSICTLGMAAEFAADGIAVNSLWPRTIIATAVAHRLLGSDEVMRRSRKPQILADAAYEVLAEAGITDLSEYSFGDDAELQRDIFLDE